MALSLDGKVILNLLLQFLIFIFILLEISTTNCCTQSFDLKVKILFFTLLLLSIIFFKVYCFNVFFIYLFIDTYILCQFAFNILYDYHNNIGYWLFDYFIFFL